MPLGKKWVILGEYFRILKISDSVSKIQKIAWKYVLEYNLVLLK